MDNDNYDQDGNAHALIPQDDYAVIRWDENEEVGEDEEVDEEYEYSEEIETDEDQQDQQYFEEIETDEDQQVDLEDDEREEEEEEEEDEEDDGNVGRNAVEPWVWDWNGRPAIEIPVARWEIENTSFWRLVMHQILRPIRWLLWPSTGHLFILNICLTVLTVIFLAMLFDEYQERTIGCRTVDHSWQGWIKDMLAGVRSILLEDCSRQKFSLFQPRPRAKDCKFTLFSLPDPN